MNARRVLYAIVCAAPVARNVGRLVALAHRDDWEVCVIATPEGRKFIDVPVLAEQTGHPVRSMYKQAGEPDMLPPADAIVVAPATVNTINKWAAGITDTLPLGLIIEGQGAGLPVVAMPFTNAAMANHPSFRSSIERLRDWGTTVLLGPDVVKPHPPGTSEQHVDDFPWHLAVDALPRR